MKRHWMLPLTAMLVALGACGGGDDDDQADVDVAAVTASASTAPAPTPPATKQVTPRPPSSTEATATTEESATTSPPTTAAPAALATWEGDTAITTISEELPIRLRVELLSLTRADDVVTLEFSLQAVGATETWSANIAFSEDNSTTGIDSVQGVTLLDLVNGNRHLTMLDEAGDCLCSGGLQFIEADQRIELYAQFPAPPADVTSVSVVIPSVPPFEDVPISEGS